MMDTSIIDLRDRLAYLFLDSFFKNQPEGTFGFQGAGKAAYIFADQVLEQRAKKAEEEKTLDAKMRKVAYGFAKYAGLEPEQALELMNCAKEGWLPTYENLTKAEN